MLIKVSIVTGNSHAALARLGNAATVCPVSLHETGEQAVRDVPALDPDVLLVDIRLPCMDGFECVSRLRLQMPDVPILMVADEEECGNELIFAAVNAGANGCVPGGLPVGEWIEAIKHVYAVSTDEERAVLMLFKSDRLFANAARYWTRLAGLVNASSTVIHYGAAWRRVVMTGKNPSGRFVRPAKNSRRQKSSLRRLDQFPPERAIVAGVETA